MNPIFASLLQAALASLASLFLGTLSLLVIALFKKALAEEAVVKHNLGDAQFGLLQNLVEIAVKEAEQLGVLGAIESKKAYAIQVVQHLADQYHIPVDAATIESLIESAIRQGLQEADMPTDEPPTVPTEPVPNGASATTPVA